MLVILNACVCKQTARNDLLTTPTGDLDPQIRRMSLYFRSFQDFPPKCAACLDWNFARPWNPRSCISWPILTPHHMTQNPLVFKISIELVKQSTWTWCFHMTCGKAYEQSQTWFVCWSIIEYLLKYLQAQHISPFVTKPTSIDVLLGCTFKGIEDSIMMQSAVHGLWR